MNFFYNQGITFVTIQPEFTVKSDNDKQNNGISIVQCLMGCQSLECAPKTCCSTNDLQMILSHGGDGGAVTNNGKVKKSTKKTTAKRPKTRAAGNKSRSLLNLNVTSLFKLRRCIDSTPDGMKKSASESQVSRIGEDAVGNDDTQNPSSSASATASPPSTTNNSQLINSSIDELKEMEFHKQCGERSEQRMPPNENLMRSHPIETTKQCEDSSLLTKSIVCNESQDIENSTDDGK